MEKKQCILQPLVFVYSTMANSKYGVMTGTSQATVYVTGVAAMILSQTERIRDASLLKERILKIANMNLKLPQFSGQNTLKWDRSPYE